MLPIVATIGAMLAEKGLNALSGFISNGADKALDIVSFQYNACVGSRTLWLTTGVSL